MAFTKEEYQAKQQLMKELQKEGYPTYARLLDAFDINLTSDPNMVAAVNLNNATIIINRYLDIEEASTIIRHEILHRYLDHALRMERHLGKDEWNNRTSQMHQIQNIAADYEISNRGYTDKDKRIVRNLKLNLPDGKEVSVRGLVTEDDHPDWVNLTEEEMYDKIMDQVKKDKEEGKESILQQSFDDIFSDPQAAKSAIQQAEEIARQAADISDQIDQDNDDEKDNEEDKEGSNTTTSSDNKEKEDDSEDKEKGSGNKEDQKNKDKADDIEQKANEIIDEIENEVEDQQEDETPLKTKQQKHDNKQKSDKLNKRISKLEELIDELKDQILDETDKVVFDERAKKAAKANIVSVKDASRYKFLSDLRNFIAKEAAYGKEASWKRPNRRYSTSGILVRGKARSSGHKVPLIAIYFDNSGSWRGIPAKMKWAEDAISVMAGYEKKGLIKIKLYYFADKISSDPNGVGGGNSIQSELYRHIQDIKADNVIIFTDGDTNSSGYPNLRIPGGVFICIADAENPQMHSIARTLKGEKYTKVYDMKY